MHKIERDIRASHFILRYHLSHSILSMEKYGVPKEVVSKRCSISFLGISIPGLIVHAARRYYSEERIPPRRFFREIALPCKHDDWVARHSHLDHALSIDVGERAIPRPTVARSRPHRSVLFHVKSNRVSSLPHSLNSHVVSRLSIYRESPHAALRA